MQSSESMGIDMRNFFLICLLVLDHSLVYFYSTTESKLYAAAENKQFTILPHTHSCITFLIAGFGIPLAPHWNGLKAKLKKKLNPITPPNLFYFFFLDYFCKLSHHGSDSVCWVLHKNREKTGQQELPSSSRNSSKLIVSLPEKNSCM